ncbi:serine/threonine protein kinase [Nocardiopsis sp. CNT-189]|uniref:serine/threonine-protein kinase n=1 Tax=Nocardiopsis oceanisediminis TaxID=2816862 RepID=UPI003B332E84
MTNMGSAAPRRLPPELAPLGPGDPETIGPFRLVGRLGAGGMGAVYGALDGAGRCIAVKVVHERFAADRRFRSAFAREVELMRRVGGMCTAPVLDADPGAGRPWVATGFVPGRTLARYVREHGPLGGEVLHAFAAGTAEALAAVHAAGVVHCDVKPANVMLAPDGPRLLDFGIARPVAAARDDGVFGSPGWMSPGRIAGRDPVPADDVFAWGGLVAFAATGRPPYGRGEPEELLRRTREEAPDVAGVPEGLLPLVGAALDRDPGARPSAEEAFRAVLARTAPAAGTAPGGALPAAPEVPETRELPAEQDPRSRLGALLRTGWSGFDAPWHRPELWVAAAPVLGAVGGTVLAGGAAGTAGGAAAGGTAAGGAAAGGAVSSAVGGAAAAGGVAGGLKTAGIAAAALLAAGAAGVGGVAAYGALTALTPQEAVVQAADLAAEAQSFRAETTFRTEMPGQEPYTSVVRHEFSAEPAIGYLRTDETADVGVTSVARDADGPVYLFDGTWSRRPPGTDVPLYSEEEFSAQWVAEELRRMADSGELREHGEETGPDGEPAAHYSGDYTVTVTSYPSGEETEYPASFDVWLDEEGLPLRLESSYDAGETGGENTTETVFSDFNAPVEVDLPEPSEIVAGRCEDSPVADRASGEVVVEPTTPGITCEQAVEVLEGYFALPPDRLQGSGGFGEYDGWTCGWVSLGGREPGQPIGSCYEQESLDGGAPPAEGAGHISLWPVQ